jgi:hypothetical protein
MVLRQFLGMVKIWLRNEGLKTELSIVYVNSGSLVGSSINFRMASRST